MMPPSSTSTLRNHSSTTQLSVTFKSILYIHKITSKATNHHNGQSRQAYPGSLPSASLQALSKFEPLRLSSHQSYPAIPSAPANTLHHHQSRSLISHRDLIIRLAHSANSGIMPSRSSLTPHLPKTLLTLTSPHSRSPAR